MKILVNVAQSKLNEEWQPVGTGGVRFKEMADGSFDFYVTTNLQRTLSFKSVVGTDEPDLDGVMPSI